MARGDETDIRAYRRGGRVADLGDLGGHRHPGGGRPPPGVRLGRLARRVGLGGDPGRGQGQCHVRHARRARARWRCPTGWPPVAVDLWDEGLASVPTTEKVELALALEAQARGADPRIRQVDHADYGDGSVEVALVSTTGIRLSSRKTSGYISVGVIAGEGDASQTGRRVQRRARVRRPRPGQGHR